MTSVTGIAPLIIAAGGGDPSTAVLPFVLLGGVFVILVGGLLFVFGRRNHRRNGE